jgi:hypothetical protein
VRLMWTERPSALTYACASVPSYALEAHTVTVGLPAALGAPLAIAQDETVQGQRTQAQWSWHLTDQRGNGFAAKATGMTLGSVITDIKVSGVPPRGKPV